jgi:hypothetical protein
MVNYIDGVKLVEDHAIAQVARCQLLTKQIQVKFRATSSEFHGGQSSTGAHFLQVIQFALYIIIPLLLHTSLSLHHDVCMVLTMQYIIITLVLN